MCMFSTNGNTIHEFPAHGMNAHERMVVHTYIHILTSVLVACEWSDEPAENSAHGTDSVRECGSTTAGQCGEQ
jgi:hypothetical protein